MATITGTANDDILTGTDDDPFTGTGGDDTINGLAGNDTIDGLTGVNTINAGEGDDVVRITIATSAGRLAQSTIEGGAGYDTLDLSGFGGGGVSITQGAGNGQTTSSISVSLSATTSAMATDIERIIATPADDTFRFVRTGMGSPVYVGSLDIYAGAGNDLVQMFSIDGNVIVHGGDGADTLYSSGSIYGDAGNDALFAQVIRLGSVLDGGDGLDTLHLSAGNGTVDLAAHTITDGSGAIVASVFATENVNVQDITTVYGDNGNNALGADPQYGSEGGGNFFGRGGDDTLTGGTRADVIDMLDGGDGNDTLNGGGSQGNDRLIGGAGFDTAIIHFMLADASLSYKTGFVDITDRSTGQIERVSGIENFVFLDQNVAEGDGAPLVDDLYYLVKNPDVAAARLDADDHYAAFGWKEGRDPDAFFSTAGYLNANLDVSRSGFNPLQHYDLLGWKEGRDPSSAFDTTLYLIHNPDVAAAGIDPLSHYLQFGESEGRAAYAAIGKAIFSDGFDPEYYLLSNTDVAAAAAASGGDSNSFAFQHYEAYGWKEGRDPNAWFDDKGYLATYTDVAGAGMNPLDHYHQFGWKEGRDPSAAFDTRDYLADNSDVAAAGIDPLLHYLQFGALEQRATFPSGTFA